MIYPGFIGGAYTSRALQVSADQCFNLYVEKVESGTGKGESLAMYGRPGLAVFTTLPTEPHRGSFSLNGRMWAVSGFKLYEVLSDGSYHERGVIRGTQPVSMACNGTQLVIVAGEHGYCLSLGDNSFVELGGGFTGANVIGYQDGYFLVTDIRSKRFQSSELYDGTTWRAIDFGSKEGFADDLVSLFVDHREVWLFGSRTTEIWWNSGAVNFQFQRIQGAFIEHGCAAVLSPAKADNTIFWLGQDSLGHGIVWRANGYTPSRVSTFAVELAISTYSRIDDAIGSSFQFQGHACYRIDFPTAGETWVLDLSSGLWSQWNFLNSEDGSYSAHRGRFHCFAFGKQLVGDYQSGMIFELSNNYYDDFGNAIERRRTAPHLSEELDRVFYDELRFDMQVGLGLADGRVPRMGLQISNDGGETYGAQRFASLGLQGEYRARAFFRRLGSSRDRVFRASWTDPQLIGCAGAYLRMTRGTG